MYWVITKLSGVSIRDKTAIRIKNREAVINSGGFLSLNLSLASPTKVKKITVTSSKVAPP